MKKYISLISILIILFNSCKENVGNIVVQENAIPTKVSDTIMIKEYLVGSEEIRKALRDGVNEFSPLDYSFMTKELSETQSNDTLFYSLGFKSDSTTSTAFWGANTQKDLLNNKDSKFIYWLTPNQDSLSPQSHYVASIVGVEMVNSAVINSSSFSDYNIDLLEGLFDSEGQIININNIPNAFEIYSAYILSENLKANAFSEVIGEDQIIEFLIKDLKNSLNIIERDSILSHKYDKWIDNLDTPSGWLYYSEDYRAALHARKLNYLIDELKTSNHPLSEKTWKALEKVKIVKAE